MILSSLIQPGFWDLGIQKDSPNSKDLLLLPVKKTFSLINKNENKVFLEEIYSFCSLNMDKVSTAMYGCTRNTNVM